MLTKKVLGTPKSRQTARMRGTPSVEHPDFVEVGGGAMLVGRDPACRRALLRSVDAGVLCYRVYRSPDAAKAITASREAIRKIADGEVPILKGSRISYGGSLNTPTNGLLVSTRYAVHPQYFRENSGFEATVTYTISTP